MQIELVRDLGTLKQVTRLLGGVFESTDAPSDEYLQGVLDNEQAWVLCAKLHDAVVGALVAFVCLPLSGQKELYIYDIAVHPDYRGRGIGRALMHTLQKAALDAGVRTLFVDAHAEDQGAIAFYRSLGGQEAAVHHFVFPVRSSSGTEGDGVDE